VCAPDLGELASAQRTLDVVFSNAALVLDGHRALRFAPTAVQSDFRGAPVGFGELVERVSGLRFLARPVSRCSPLGERETGIKAKHQTSALAALGEVAKLELFG